MNRIGQRAIICLFLIAPLSGAKAVCMHDPVRWEFGQTLAFTWVTDDKSVCTTGHLRPQNIAKIEIETKPKHGIAGKDGPFGIAYKPQPGFHGSDTFTYAITSNSNSVRGAGVVARITIFVTVQ